jgi:membrane protease YdiL (CAAX protease family)
MPIPWSAALMGAYLWLYIRFLDGKLWPGRSADERPARLRWRCVSRRAWFWSLLAGALAFASLIAARAVIGRMIELPREPAPDVSQYPRVAVILLVFMSALVAGIAEEAGFRGYMQVPIERSHGFAVAVLISGFCFALFHFTHSWMAIALVPAYMIISLVYGSLAFVNDSILPNVVLHAGGNFIGGLMLLYAPRQESPPLVWSSGTDGRFWVELTVAIALAAAACLAFRRLVVAESRTALATIC